MQGSNALRANPPPHTSWPSLCPSSPLPLVLFALCCAKQFFSYFHTICMCMILCIYIKYKIHKWKQLWYLSKTDSLPLLGLSPVGMIFISPIKKNKIGIHSSLCYLNGTWSISTNNKTRKGNKSNSDRKGRCQNIFICILYNLTYWILNSLLVNS